MSDQTQVVLIIALVLFGAYMLWGGREDPTYSRLNDLESRVYEVEQKVDDLHDELSNRR
jgi:hypothetical protein